MQVCKNYHIVFISPFITIGPTFSSHNFVVICYLGWDDGTFLVSKVESIGCDCYENHYEKKCVLTLALRLNF
jgi:hypothetical protein